MRSPDRKLLVTALLALLVAVAGCADGGSDESATLEGAPDAAALQENVTAAMEDVETVAFSIEQSTEGGGGGTVSGDAVMNLTAEKARINMTARSQMGEQSMTQYIVGETAYVHANDEWLRMNLTGMSPWNQSNQLSAQQQMLENGSVEVTGREALGESDVWVVAIEPDPEQFRSLVAQQSGVGSMPENLEILGLQATQYVDVETDRVRRVEMEVRMRNQGQNVTTAMNMTFESFDQPTDITLPAGAENATEMGAGGGGSAHVTATPALERADR